MKRNEDLMGLDMSLYAKIFLSSDYGEDHEKRMNDTILEYLDAQNIPYLEKSTIGICVQLAYWHKANQIHRWIIENCTDSIDNCDPIYLSKIELDALHKTIRKVLDNKRLAPKLLPTTSGLFFGSTDYDDFYFLNLEYAIERLDIVLKAYEKGTIEAIYYQGSW